MLREQHDQSTDVAETTCKALIGVKWTMVTTEQRTGKNYGRTWNQERWPLW